MGRMIYVAKRKMATPASGVSAALEVDSGRTVAPRGATALSFQRHHQSLYNFSPAAPYKAIPKVFCIRT